MYFMLTVVAKRETRETYNQLNLLSLATSGDQKAIRAQLRALKKEMR